MEKLLLTIDEAAELLSVSRRTIYEMCSARGRARREHPLPVVKLNSKCLRFRRESLEECLLAKTFLDRPGIQLVGQFLHVPVDRRSIDTKILRDILSHLASFQA